MSVSMLHTRFGYYILHYDRLHENMISIEIEKKKYFHESRDGHFNNFLRTNISNSWVC